MRSFVILASCFLLAQGKPPANDKVGTARWLLSQTSWGVLTTTSIHLDGAAFGNPISVAEIGGTPYFYVALMDTSTQDLQKSPKCTLSLSEASVDCAKLTLDPEDPRCIRLSLSGTMVNVTDQAEHEKAKAVLFDQHPAMKHWAADHSWLVQKLDLDDIWMVDKFGGPASVPKEDYFAAKAPVRGKPQSSVHTPTHAQPSFKEKAKTARWLVHESTWATLATTSVHLAGIAFGNPISIADGPDTNATGVPYMLVSTLDTSTQDLLKNDKCTLTFSQAAVNCALNDETGALDPEDPRCTRLSLTGRVEGVKDQDEKVFAEKALVAKHPAMSDWLGLGDFHVVKMNIQNIWLINYFGGASDISVEDYVKASSSEIVQSVAHATPIQFV